VPRSRTLRQKRFLLMYRLWLRFGIRKGWISPPYCATHDGGYDYMTEEERAEWDEGGDPCHVSISVLQ
jgi:hypothetical protein